LGDIATNDERLLRSLTAAPAVSSAGNDADAGLAAGFSATLLLPAPARTSERDAVTRPALRAADVLGLGLAAGGATLLSGDSGAAILAVFGVLALALIQLFGLYARDAAVLRPGMLDELPRVIQALTFAASLTVVLGPSVFGASTGLTTIAWALSAATVPVTRKVSRSVVRRLTADERVLILGSGTIADLVAEKVAKHPELGLEIVGCLDVVGESRPARPSALRHLGTLADVDRVIEDERVGTVVIAFSAVPHEDLLDAIRRCKRRRVKISVVPRLFEVIGSRVELHDIEGLTLLGLRGPVRSRGALAAKRGMDIAGSVAALTILSPLLLVIALCIRVTSRGPVFFQQERIGRGQRPFRMYKFRTMVADADERKADVLHLNEFVGGRMFKIAQDPRVTPVGRFLRATSLDELPQFANVLLGEMSIVGPRPLIREENDAVLGWHRTRLDLMPGLTGPWQVMGRQHVPFDEMVKLDYLYVAEWSFWNDVKLALRTIPVVLRRTGA
jgi:exopolysaccharide biosynthesis polyprenyl glycosylphosphotransferase